MKCLSLLFILLAFTSIAVGQSRLLSDPAISTTHIAFKYADDLWIADRDGSNVRRLTVHEGHESHPVFSPDGKTLAFSGNYDGNTDVYTVPVAGGIPERLTWHPYDDEVQSFTADGERILFTSQREVFTNRFDQLFTIGREGGPVKALDIPTAAAADYSTDGRYIAYTPLGDRSSMWKNYRGGTASRIWIFDMRDKSVNEVPKPETGSNDNQPAWLDGHVYFRGDREGEYNLYRYDPGTETMERLTDFTDFPVISLSAGPEGIVFEQAGYLHYFEVASQETERLDIEVNADILDVRPRYVSGPEHVRSVAPSPTGKRLLFGYRGEVITAPVERGDVDNLTQTTGVHEQSPAWSPDGKHIAYFSDASGEYSLHLRPRQVPSLALPMKERIREIPLDGTGFYSNIHWSPDGEKLTFVDNGRHLYILDVGSGEVTTVDQDTNYGVGAYRDLFGSWSPDGRYLAYTKVSGTNFELPYIYDTQTGERHPLTDGLANATEPTFDASGKYLYMAVSTDAGPVVNWFQQSSNDMRATNDLYLVTLERETENPLKRRNDREEINAADASPDTSATASVDGRRAAVAIDFEGLQNRVVHLPVPNGNYRNLASPAEGELLFVAAGGEGATIRKFTLEDREATDVVEASGFTLTADGKKMLVYQGDRYGITPLDDPKAEDMKYGKSYNLTVKIDPRAEWQNIFNEMWRVNRDYFYDPNMHGVDWAAMKEKYEPFLEDVMTSQDLYRVMEWMGSELGVGHHRFGRWGGTPLEDRDYVAGGLLGADYNTANGRYRFAKIYGGLNWNQDLRAPLTEPGVNVEEGEYLLAVDGQELTADDNLYRLFERTAGRNIDITVGPNADGSDARTVTVTPVKQEFSLRNRDWVEGNIEKVNEATNGRVAYVYVPNTGGGGFEYFKRYFFPQVDKQAVIVDERFNGGGQIADYYIELLMRPYQNSWTYRYGEIQHAPVASIQGPKVLLIDETAGSGGDLFPYLWRQNDLGPIIGKRTWGGLVGVLGFPTFIDGGSVTAPNVAFWDENGYRVENEGVAPDIEVEQLPAEVMAGRDPQLERAIEEVLKLLEEEPVARPRVPAFEKRGRAVLKRR